MHFADMIYFWARIAPDRQAVIQPEIITSYKGLADAIESISNRIAALNLDHGAPIAVSIANPVIFLSVLVALLRLGHGIAPVTKALYPHLRGAGIKDLIYDVDGQVTSGGRNIRFDPSWLPIVGSTSWSKQANVRARGSGSIHDIKIVLFTSGTTGLPKKVVHSLAGLGHRLTIQFAGSDATIERALIVPTASSPFGLVRVFGLLNAGKTACLAPFGEAMLNLINTFQIDCLVGSPQQMLSLSELKEKMPHYELDSLQTILMGGAPIGYAGIKRIRETLCPNLINQYSSTEAGMAAIGPFDLTSRVPGAVGFITPWTELEIVDEAGAVLSTGTEGLVRYRTPMFPKSMEASNAIQDASDLKDWFYPGDIGRVTDDGLLCLSGRSSDVINRGGVKISATRIAEVIESRPDIKEAAACGIEGHSGMEEVWIAVVPNGDVDLAALKDFVLQHEDVGAVVDEIFIVNDIPRGDLGKIQKIRLKEMLLRLKGGT
jgi:acyl-coenzyme A synthetase/AMP-(fatty) acid ligase